MLDVIKNRKIWFSFSGTLIVIAVVALCFNLFVRGEALNFGIDFTGGTLINLRFERPVSIGEVRGVLDEFKLGESVIQKSGETDILIRTVPIEGDVRAKIMSDLNTKVATSEILEADVAQATRYEVTLEVQTAMHEVGKKVEQFDRLARRGHSSLRCAI